ncbi:MAG: ribonuclease HII [Candidatus Omnitrophota bacterium]
MARKKTYNNLPDRLLFEKKAFDAGFKVVAGIDEAGRGPLAGPVVASAVIVRDTAFDERIDDSKKMTQKMRERAFLEILEKCDVGIGIAGVEEIDGLNIFNATLLAMKRAIFELKSIPDHLLIDGKMRIPVDQPQVFLIKGESVSVSIACASIIAKVYRDSLMTDLDTMYPQYGFAKHKGYGTREHMDAIRKNGLCPIHRQSFGPFGNMRGTKKNMYVYDRKHVDTWD